MSGTRKCINCHVVSIPSDMKYCSLECEQQAASRIAESTKNKGLKYDGNKPDLSIIPKAALDGMARVFTFGAQKYGRDNYRGGMEWTRLTAAALRHITAWQEREDLDPETQLSHIAHALCCLSMLAYYIETRKGTDNRAPLDASPLDTLGASIVKLDRNNNAQKGTN